MITQAVFTLDLSASHTYTFPSSFQSLDQVVYTSADGSTYNPNFTDYTLDNGTITIPSTYSGTVDLYYSYNDTLSNSSPSGAKRTLEDMYLKFVIDCALETSELNKDSSGNYLDTVLFTRFRNEVNRAVRKIARERFQPTVVQTVTLDSNQCFDITALAKTFYSIQLLTDSNGREYLFERVSSTQYKVPDGSAGDTLNLTYEYVPTDMTLLTDTIDLPDGDVDPDVIGYFANYMYFKVEGNRNKAGAWLEMWNDSLGEINSSRGEVTQIKDYYGTFY